MTKMKLAEVRYVKGLGIVCATHRDYIVLTVAEAKSLVKSLFKELQKIK